jgi:hypothetical protein
MRYTMLAMVVAVVAGCGVEGGAEPAEVGEFADPVYVLERVDPVTEAGWADHAIGCQGAEDVLITGACEGSGVEVVDAYGDDAGWHCGIRADAVAPDAQVRIRALCLGPR